jgi:hypothetical protein
LNAIINNFKPSIKLLWATRRPSHFFFYLHDQLNIAYKKTNLASHMDAGVDWLCAAHDACDQTGVSAMYSFLRGWLPPYPETTGYIIPTLFNCGKFLNKSVLLSRAVKMADWEIQIQMENGAFQGMYWQPNQIKVEPTVFNTGQIVIGLVKALEITKNLQYATAIEKAAHFLVSIQEQDGSWMKCLGPTTKGPVYSYNSRVGFSLILAGKFLGRMDLVAAGEKNIKWTLKQQKSNGWFSNAAFVEGNNPLTHTIAYCMEGILGTGILLDKGFWIDKIIISADHLMNIFHTKGMLPATFNQEWQSHDNYQCVTGNCQIAIIWLQLYQITGLLHYYEAASQMIDFLIGLQNIYSKNKGIRGGLKGSHPIGGSYVPYALVNWATKFFVDLLLLKLEIDNTRLCDPAAFGYKKSQSNNA